MAARSEGGSSVHDDDDDGGDFADWGSEQEDAPIRSLLSAEMLGGLDDVLSELKSAVGFDFNKFASSLALGTYERLKLANYLRSTQLSAAGAFAAGASGAAGKHNPAVVSALKAAVTHEALHGIEASWKRDQWLQPVLEDDGLVMGILAAFDDEDDERGALDDDVKEALLSAASALAEGGAGAGARKTVGGGAGAGSAAAAAAAAAREKDEEIAFLRAQVADLRAALVRNRDLLLAEDSGSDDGSDGAGSEGRGAGAGAGVGAAAKAAERRPALGPDGQPKRKLSDADEDDAAAVTAASTSGVAGAGAGKAGTAAQGAAGAGAASKGAKPAPADAATGTAAGSFAGVNGQDNDSYYFDSYAKIGIHADMLGDTVRTESYRDAIRALVPRAAASGDRAATADAVAASAAATSAAAAPGPVVLDVGCGTGVLSLFSVQAGARRVVAVDASGIIEDAREIAAANGLDGSVAFLRGKAEEVDVPGAAAAASTAGVAAASQAAKKAGDAGAPPRRCADVLVSEWMGYALLYESMLSSVLVCRDRYLKPGGLMLPSKASIHVAGVCDPRMWAKRVAFWDDVYGLSMRNMKRHLFREAYVEVLPAESIVTAPAAVRHLNLLTMRDADQDFVDAPFTLQLEPARLAAAHAAARAPEPGASGSEAKPAPAWTAAVAAGEPRELHGLCLWFDIDFDAERFDPAAVAGAADGDGTVKSTSATLAGAAAAAEGGKPGAAWGVEDDGMPALEEETAPSSAATAAAGAAGAGAASSTAAAPAPQKAAVSFSTGPHVKPTHWAQTFFLFERPVAVPASGAMAGTLTMTRDAVNPREYRFAITLREAPQGAMGAEATGAAKPGPVLLQQTFHMR